ncbi:MAG: ATP phosphoribosyltransferase [Myxococcota bacterium]
MLKVALPKGRIFDRVHALLSDCGISLRMPDRAYRPECSDDRLSVKVLKAQNVAALVGLGAHDLGFTGHDWVRESQADVVELLDLGFDPVRIVAAVPAATDLDELFSRERVVVVSEYEHLTRSWLEARNVRYHFMRSYGATEVFPPEDADLIVDNTASGRTLVENGLRIADTLLQSTTRVVAHPSAMADPERRVVIEELMLLMRAVLDARDRVMLEMNIEESKLGALVATLPAMKSPTVSQLYGQNGYAVKVAVRRAQVARLIPELKRLGATDILETELRKVIP